MKGEKLSLGELELAASSALTVLLSLDHSRVSGKEAVCVKGRLVGLVLGYESAGNAVAACTGLSGRTAACDGDDDIELAFVVSCHKGLLDLEDAQRIAEILFDISSVDCNLSVAFAKVNACNCCLSASGTLTEIDVLFFCLSHIRTS